MKPHGEKFTVLLGAIEWCLIRGVDRLVGGVNQCGIGLVRGEGGEVESTKN